MTLIGALAVMLLLALFGTFGYLLGGHEDRARTDAAIDEAIAVTWDKPARPAGPRLAKRIDVLTCDCIWMWEAATGWRQHTYECGLHEQLREITR